MSRIIIFLLISLPSFALAQSGDVLSDTITWSATSNKNLQTGDTVVRNVTFVTYDSVGIDLIINSNTHSFEITSKEGIWPDISTPGSIVFHVLFGESVGLVTIVRDDNGLSLTLDMSVSSPTGIHNQYFIDHTSVN